MAIYVPIIMYGLRLFIVVLCTRSTMFTELFTCLYDQSYHITKFCYSITYGFCDS